MAEKKFYAVIKNDNISHDAIIKNDNISHNAIIKNDNISYDAIIKNDNISYDAIIKNDNISYDVIIQNDEEKTAYFKIHRKENIEVLNGLFIGNHLYEETRDLQDLKLSKINDLL